MPHQSKKHLPRLGPEAYRGQAFVHWTMTIPHRQTGLLIPAFNDRFRELLTHAAFRYVFTCPIYCLMPDHIHMIWIGLDDRTDQLKASKYFCKQLGIPLSKLGFEFQHQAYDHVLHDDERKEEAFENLVEYIARNPERRELVPIDGFREYKYTGCLVPGYPELELWQEDFWPRFESRSLGKPETVFEFEKGEGGGDGCAFDAWGNLYSMRFRTGEIRVIDIRKKRLIATLPTGVVPASNMTFGGPSNQELFVSAARYADWL